MPPLIADLPLRQKILLSITVVGGLFILFAYHSTIIDYKSFNSILFFYGLGVPMFLLSGETLIDLDKSYIFKIWSCIAFLFLIIYFLTKGDSNFIIQRSANYGERARNRFISNSWAAPFKALPIFLICYYIFNFIVKKKTGNYIVNTFRLSRWYNDTAQRKIYWYDVLITFTLLAIIICASLFEF